MKQFATLLLLAGITTAQVRATLTKVPISGTQVIFGKPAKNAQAGVWILTMIPTEPGPIAIPRERIVAAFPEVPLYPNMLGQDLIDAKIAQDPRHAIPIFGTLIKKLGPAALSTYGLAKHVDAATYAGLGIGTMLEIVDLIVAAHPVPNPREKYYPQFCPETQGSISTPGSAFVIANDSGLTCYITSGLCPRPTADGKGCADKITHDVVRTVPKGITQ